jgi:hypothetical protein
MDRLSLERNRMSVAKRITSDLWRLRSIPLPADVGAAVIVTHHELKKCGWSDDDIETLNELIATD